jgi:hypothetical protein
MGAPIAEMDGGAAEAVPSGHLIRRALGGIFAGITEKAHLPGCPFSFDAPHDRRCEGCGGPNLLTETIPGMVQQAGRRLGEILM